MPGVDLEAHNSFPKFEQSLRKLGCSIRNSVWTCSNWSWTKFKRVFGVSAHDILLGGGVEFVDIKLEKSPSRSYNALRGNRTPGGSSSHPANEYGNDPGYHYPINATDVCLWSSWRVFSDLGVYFSQ